MNLTIIPSSALPMVVLLLLQQQLYGANGQSCEPNQFQITTTSTCQDCIDGNLDFDLSISPPLAIGCICPSSLIQATSSSGGIECIDGVVPTVTTTAPAVAPVLAEPTSIPSDAPTPVPILVTPTLTLGPVGNNPAIAVTAPVLITPSLTAAPVMATTVVSIILSLVGVSADEIEGALDDLAQVYKDTLDLGPNAIVTASLVESGAATAAQVTAGTSPQIQQNSVDVLLTIELPQPSEPGDPPVTAMNILQSMDESSDELVAAIQESSPAFMNLESLEADIAPTESPTVSPIDGPASVSSAPIDAPTTTVSPINLIAPTVQPIDLVAPPTARPTGNDETTPQVSSSSSDDEVCAGTLLPTIQMHWKFLFLSIVGRTVLKNVCVGRSDNK